MDKFIESSPEYLVVLAVCVFVVYRVITMIINESEPDSDSSDEDGGVAYEEEPKLDLPPGITLPVDSREPSLQD